MRHGITRLCSLAVILTLLLSLITGCGNKQDEFDADKLLESLLKEVTYSGELKNIDDNAKMYFSELPEDTTVKLYTVGGYFADEVALLTFKDESNSAAAEKIIKSHVKELREQFLNYVPKEVGKIDNAVIFQNGKYIFLCITNDYKTAKNILSGKNTDTKNTKISEKRKKESNEKEEKKKYPQIKSKSGEYHLYDGAAIRVDNSAFELYTYVDSTADSYASIVNKTAKSLKGKTNVYALAIPTAIGVVFPDDIAKKYTDYSDQGKAIEKIYSKMSESVKTVNCFENMMMHRNEYLYFRTDFHWNGRGAFYAYDSFCKTKGIATIPLSERTEKKFKKFLGELYWNNTGKDANIGNTPDTVLAYCPKSTTATMKFTDKNGNTYPWNIIHDVSSYKSSVKYSTFTGGDNPITVFKNPDITDGSVCVVVKESFGNALLPFLVDHYSTIYEIDYRYWEGSLTQFAEKKNATDLIFANNLSMIRSNYLVGKLSEITG